MSTGGPQTRAPRRRDPPYRRLDLRTHAPLRAGGRRYNNYINLLPNKDRSDKAAWSRSQVRFLKSFGENQPIALDEAYAAGFTPSTSESSMTRSL